MGDKKMCQNPGVLMVNFIFLLVFFFLRHHLVLLVSLKHNFIITCTCKICMLKCSFQMKLTFHYVYMGDFAI